MKRTFAIAAALAAALALPAVAEAGVRLKLDAGLAGLGVGVSADHRAEPPMQMARQERRIPLPQVIARLKAQTGGEYVSANVMDQGGRTVYWIRMRHPGGRFVDYTVDAQTGQIISEQGG